MVSLVQFKRLFKQSFRCPVGIRELALALIALQFVVPHTELHGIAYKIILPHPGRHAFAQHIQGDFDVLVGYQIPWSGGTVADGMDE